VSKPAVERLRDPMAMPSIMHRPDDGTPAALLQGTVSRFSSCA